MLYYYVNTGHKIGLERLRRGVALLKYLSNHGEKTQLLVNDFRAGLVARELGVSEYVTIETIQDIDAIAQNEDSIVIDSVEDDHGRLVKYCSDFSQVWRFAEEKDDITPIHTEMLIPYDTVMVDEYYFEPSSKENRVGFFLSDADYDKTILGHADFFSTFDMELLLGNYFFVKYEDALGELFSVLHEPEEYENFLTTTQTIVTASSQAALEAKASGAKVIYLSLGGEALYNRSLLESYGIVVIDGFDKEKLHYHLQNEVSNDSKNIEKIDAKTILKKH